MKPLSILCAIAAVAIYASDKPASVPAPIVVGSPPGELAAAQARITELEAQIAGLISSISESRNKSRNDCALQSPTVVQPVAAKPTPSAATGGPVGHYERRSYRYGLFGGKVGYETVWVQDKPYADGLQPPVRYYSRGCTSGRCGRW